MILQAIEYAEKDPRYGGKINSLIDLCQLGLLVPKGYFISQDYLSGLWKLGMPDWSDRLEYQNGSLENTYQEALTCLESLTFPPEMVSQIEELVQEGKNYIVRSSGILEDHAHSSFAGQYDSVGNCQTACQILAAIKYCLASLWKPSVLSYWQTKAVGSLDSSDFGMSLIIQEEISAQVSGVAFTIDPRGGIDHKLMVELVAGSGENLVSGLVNPQRLSMDWFSSQMEVAQDQACLLSRQKVEQLKQELLTVASFYGYPLDLEFCFDQEKLYFLQARPITSMSSHLQEGLWTNANFRDGGVAAGPCPALMWSLYQHAWQKSLGDFLLDNQLYQGTHLPALIRYQFARPYWNLGLVKEVMSGIPGYVEKDFDEELGIKKYYQGSGLQSPWTVKSLSHLAKIAWKLSKTTKKQVSQAEDDLARLLKQYDQLEEELEALDANSHQTDLEKLWKTIVIQAYMDCETRYFRQVFVNTVQLSMKKTALLKKLPMPVFFQVVSKLGRVSHLKLLQAVEDTVEVITSQSEVKEDWLTMDSRSLSSLLETQPERQDAQAIAAFQHSYGYHSRRELNLLVASYREDKEEVVSIVQSYLKEPDTLQGLTDSLSQSLSSDQISSLLKPYYPSWRIPKVLKELTKLRHLLWLREEYKDMSTRYYHLIRQISLKLGVRYHELGYLDQAEDLFYLEKEMVNAFIEGNSRVEDLQKHAKNNRLYCQAYSHFDVPSELMSVYQSNTLEDDRQIETSLQGIGANHGLVSGSVRVLFDAKEIDHIQPGEILVTHFTDTGWSHAFSTIAGLVTETGGILCHASIVAREFGLPTIVCAKGATSRLRTGMKITMNGTSGQITLHSEEE